MRYVLFTDAASYNNGQKDPSKPQHSYSGAILTYNTEIVKKFGKFNPNSTNNYGEIMAICHGLKKSIKYLKKQGIKDIELDVFSDSEICVRGLNEWIFGWKRNAKDGIWYSSSNAKVANQEIFKEIDEIISHKKYKKLFKNYDPIRLNIRIFHTRGHIDLSKPKDVEKAMKSFKRVNGIEIPLDVLSFIINMNNEVDRYAVKNLKGKLLGYHE